MSAFKKESIDLSSNLDFTERRLVRLVNQFSMSTIISKRVDHSRINQKKVSEFIVSNGLESPSDFPRMRPTCYDPAFETSYHRHYEVFLIKQSVEKVWRIYESIHPREAWVGSMVSFGVQYSQQDNTLNYLDDEYAGMQPGQLLILNLRLLMGLINIAVAHQVAEVNEEEKSFKLCYIKGGASEGSQWISLHETEDGHTEVRHLTLYKSDSRFRDTMLYPRLHTKAIAEFHQNIKRRAEGISS